jgi:hypothetical protein
MTRISQDVPMKAYDHITQLLTDAGGKNGRIGRDEAKALVKQLKKDGRGTEALAAEYVFKMIDARDARPGHQVTGYDLKKDRSYVQEKLLENRDLNNNGYSAAEIANMSTTGRALVELGQQLEIQAARGRIPQSTPERGLFHIATMIRQAAEEDLITSQKDANAFAAKLQKEGRGAEALAFRTFYSFIDHRDAAPGARISDADITRAVDYALETLLAAKDKNNNGYSKAEADNFSTSAKAFLLIGKMIEKGILSSAMPIDGADTRDTLSKAVRGQQFDQMGSEGGQDLRAVHREGSFKAVNEASFRKAFEMPKRSIQVIEKFKAEDLRRFIEVNGTSYDGGEARLDPALADRAFKTTAMLRSLTDLKVIVTGKGDEGLLATYIVGLAPDKSMVGIQTGVVWT